MKIANIKVNRLVESFNPAQVVSMVWEVDIPHGCKREPDSSTKGILWITLVNGKQLAIKDLTMNQAIKYIDECKP